MEESKSKPQMIRHLLWECVHTRVDVASLCDLIVGYIPHSTVRACSLLHNPFKIVETSVVDDPCQELGVSMFSVGADGVGRDFTFIIQPGTFKRLRGTCGPPVHPKDWTIEMKHHSETKNNITVDTFVVFSTRRDDDKKSVTHSIRMQATRMGERMTVPRISLAPDQKMFCYTTNSKVFLDGNTWYETGFYFDAPHSSKKTKAVVIQEPDDRQIFVDSRVDWLHGNRHIAIDHDEYSVLVLQIPDQDNEEQDAGSSSIVRKMSDEIPVMFSEKMDYSWSHKLVHEFPVIFAGEVSLHAVHPSKNQFIVIMEGYYWLIAYKDNIWWIVGQIENAHQMTLKWSLLGTHLILHKLLEGYYVVVDHEEKTILDEKLIKSRSADIVVVENDPQTEYEINNQIVAKFCDQKNNKVDTNGPFFLALTASQIHFFCRETGELLQIIQFDESKETCVDLTWNSSRTRIFVLVRDKTSQTHRVLTLTNHDFEAHLRSTFEKYPTTVNYQPVVNNDAVEFMGFFL